MLHGFSPSDGHHRPSITWMDTVTESLKTLVTAPLTPMDPWGFTAHLFTLLSIYELGPFPGTPIPRYEGPTDWQKESILKSLDVLARRMRSAEEDRCRVLQTIGWVFNSILDSPKKK